MDNTVSKHVNDFPPADNSLLAATLNADADTTDLDAAALQPRGMRTPPRVESLREIVQLLRPQGLSRKYVLLTFDIFTLPTKLSYK